MTKSTTAPTSTAGSSSAKRRSVSPAKPASPSKDKGKNAVTNNVHRGVEDDDGDDDDDDEEEEEEEEEEDYEMDMDDDEVEEEEEGAGENNERIDPKAILPPGTRRTRGQRVDYTSAEALQRAGLKNGEDDDEEMQ